MLWLKAAGAVLVTAAGAALGLYYSGLEENRAQDLSEFKKALLILASEIEFIAVPLPEAMRHIAERTEGPAGALFNDFAEKAETGGETAYRLWEGAVEQNKKRGYLTAEDWDMLLSFGKTLGYLDKAMQLNAIRHVTDYIDGKVGQLRSGGVNKRMYRSLGIIGGLLVAVTLW